MIIDLSAAIQAVGSLTDVRRHVPAAVSHDPDTGLLNAGEWATIRVVGSLQPLESRQVRHLRDELERVDDAKRFFTDTPLLVTDKKTGRLGDQVVENGEAYEVVKDSDWHGIAAYGEYVVRKVL